MPRNDIGEVAETLLDYVEHNKTFQAGKIMSVPAASYTDPDQWRAEIDLIFKRVPLMLALSCELPNSGDYKAIEIVGVPVLIARDKTGAVRTFLNVCAHRWAPVAAAGHGNCSRFICPFHGWTYGADGKLTGVSDRAKFGALDQSTHGLKQLSCEERHGMIFACLTPELPLHLDGYYGRLLEECASFDLQGWSFLGSRTIDGANWKLTFNNFLETYHFATLHDKTVAVTALPNVNHYEGFGPNMRTTVVQRTIGRLREVPRAKWCEREGWEFTFIRIFFPNVTVSFSFEPEISVITQTLPGPTPDKCKIVLLYVRKDPPKNDTEREAIRKTIDFATVDVSEQEDNAVSLNIQRAFTSSAHAGLLYGRNEAGNQYFHEWLNWYVKNDSTRPKPVLGASACSGNAGTDSI